MATWNDIFVQEVTATPAPMTSVTLTLNNAVTVGNKLILFVATAGSGDIDDTTLTAGGWNRDTTVISIWKHGYVYSKSVTSQSDANVTVDFTASSRPVLRLMELTGVGLLQSSAPRSDSLTTGQINTSTSDEMLYLSVVHGVTNGGVPAFNTWSDLFNGLGSVSSAAGPPHGLPEGVIMGVGHRISSAPGVYQTTATVGGTEGPEVIAIAAALISYKIGAGLPIVNAGSNVTIPVNNAFARTATDDANGGTITGRSWVVDSGPAQAGIVLSTSVSLSWTPTVDGVYVIKYSATNSAGTSEASVTVTVVAPIIVIGSSSPVTSTALSPGHWQARIRAKNSNETSSYSAWSNTFTVYSGQLNLPQIDWWGGPSYYEQFSKANAAGWSDPSFFPIAVFYAKPEHTSALKSVGINTLMGAEHDGASMSSITSTSMFVLAQGEWTPAEVGNDPRVVGWHVSDECDMGYSGCASDEGEYGSLAIQTDYANYFRSLNDGRFLQANFGNGVLGTYWSPNTMPDHVALMDMTCVDKYAYTSPHVQDLFRGSPHWPADKNPASAGAYGWQQDRMESFASPAKSKPNFTFIESAKPFLEEPGQLLSN